MGLPSISGVSPANREARVPPDVILKGYVGDDAYLTVNVTFYNASNGGILCTNTSIAVNTTVGCKNFSDLPFNQEFCWIVNVSNGSYDVSSSQCFTTRRTGLHIDLDEQVTTFGGLGGLIIDLVDVGLNTLIHVLQRFPEIAVLLFIVGVILGILGMVTGVFTSIGGIFRMITDTFSKKK